MYEGFPLGSTRTGLVPEGRRYFKYSTIVSRTIGFAGFMVFIVLTITELLAFGTEVEFNWQVQEFYRNEKLALNVRSLHHVGNFSR